MAEVMLSKGTGESNPEHLQRHADLTSSTRTKVFKVIEKVKKMVATGYGKAEKLEGEAFTIRKQISLAAGREMAPIIVSKEYLIAFPTIKALAEAVGVSSKTVHQWTRAHVTGAFSLYETSGETLQKCIERAQTAMLPVEEQEKKTEERARKAQDRIANAWQVVYNAYLRLAKEQRIMLLRKIASEFKMLPTEEITEAPRELQEIAS